MPSRLKSWGAALTAAAIGLVFAFLFDARYHGSLITRERSRLLDRIRPFAVSLEGALNRRAGRLAGVQAFVEGHRTLAKVLDEFPAFAEGIRTTATDIRGIQLNRDGRILATHPPSDAALLLGVNLLTDRRTPVVDGVRRAMATDSLVITGPVTLLQGGEGLILRLRTHRTDRTMPDMVTIAIDLPTLLAETSAATGIPADIVSALFDREGRLLRGEADGLESPVVLPIRLGDGAFTLKAAPRVGWNAAVAPAMLPTRLGSLLIVLLISWLAYGATGRQDRLTAAVDERTRELEAKNVELQRSATERLRLEEQLLHSQKMEAVGTLAGGVAHDFNNLLTAILGFTQLAHQQVDEVIAGNGHPGPQKASGLQAVKTDLGEIAKAADRASLLTSQLLAFSRRQQVKVTTLDAAAVVRDLERMLQRLIGATVSLETTTTSTVVPIRADGGQFAQVIVNLVVNARDAMPAGGRIRLEVQAHESREPGGAPLLGLPAGTWALVRVQDEGIGMSPEVQARMFEPFFTTKPLGQGTGLGLSTVYGIVTQAGGQLFVDSAVGVGTTVTVAWPRLESLEAATDPVRESADVATQELVLVVEDEPGLRRLVGEILRRRGYRVCVAEDGVDALAQIDGGLRPALVLTDVVMPRMGGRELASRLGERALPLPVLFMSGYQAGEELPDDASHAFIGKPFTPDSLVAAVRAAMRAGVEVAGRQP